MLNSTELQVEERYASSCISATFPGHRRCGRTCAVWGCSPTALSACRTGILGAWPRPPVSFWFAATNTKKKDIDLIRLKQDYQQKEINPYRTYVHDISH